MVAKTRMDNPDPAQGRLNLRPDNLHARLVGMENDLAIIKECLVTRMRSAEQP